MITAANIASTPKKMATVVTEGPSLISVMSCFPCRLVIPAKVGTGLRANLGAGGQPATNGEVQKPGVKRIQDRRTEPRKGGMIYT